MSTTTLKIKQETKGELDQFREYKDESYDEVIRKVLFIARSSEKNPKLSKETLRQIAQARKRIKAGHFITNEEARKRLGL
jgi:hypothetical protein